MRQHVNPLSKVFKICNPIPPLQEIFKQPDLPLHIDIGCGSGKFLFQLASQNNKWNYLGIEIREKLVLNANLKLKRDCHFNLFFLFGNANNLLDNYVNELPKDILQSVSFNFPDPWFKKKHYKRRVVQTKLIENLSQLMTSNSLIYIKSDVKDLYVHMDLVIKNSQLFKEYNYPENQQLNKYNPNNIKTCREIYAMDKHLKIYEKIYKKI